MVYLAPLVLTYLTLYLTLFLDQVFTGSPFRKARRWLMLVVE